MTGEQLIAQAIKRLRHQLGVSEQNFRLSGSPKHYAKAIACRAALAELGASDRLRERN